MSRVAFANTADGYGNDVDADCAAAFAGLVEEPPWRALADAAGLVAWRAGWDAQDEAGRVGHALWGASVNVVEGVRDAAFCARVARKKNLDQPLSDLVRDLDANHMSTAHIEAAVAQWPQWARARFALVDRRGVRTVFGGDGGAGASFRFENIEGLTIFRLHNGGVLLPWPARLLEVSTCFIVDDNGEPHHLGAARVDANPPHSASRPRLLVEVERGGLRGGTDVDDAALERARAVVEAAANDGYRGACAVDAFTWTDAQGDQRLRGAAWFHARFTRAHVALGLIAQQRPPPGARFAVVDGDVVEELPA